MICALKVITLNNITLKIITLKIKTFKKIIQYILTQNSRAFKIRTLEIRK